MEWCKGSVEGVKLIKGGVAPPVHFIMECRSLEGYVALSNGV